MLALIFKTIPLHYFMTTLEKLSAQKQRFTSLENLTIVTVSRWLANEVEHSFLAKYPVRVIYNGVDTDVFRPVGVGAKLKYNIENKFLILGVATVWNARKGLSDFIKLANIFHLMIE
ncbi:hypothetical protein ACIXMT_19310 [Bacteroides fragilis]